MSIITLNTRSLPDSAVTTAKIAADAGADWIVTGTLTEDADNLEDLRTKLLSVISAINS